MGTPLQLVAEYYQSVLKCEKIFNTNAKQNNLSDLMLTRENISLRNQLQQLSLDLQVKEKEIENAKRLHKTQKALLETKLASAKAALRKKTPQSSESGSDEIERVKFHLLSPIQNERSRSFEKQPSRLRQVIDRNQATLFDDETDDTANRTDDVLFLNSLKPNNDARYKVDEVAEDISTEFKKKRKLSNKKIEINEVLGNSDEEALQDEEMKTKITKMKGLFKV
ncbi:unnamed protein product [Kluyveromyces dobzhanskii CBS 2104]|uniref:WGS project CCBQ000000000 data, contig 00105 n=1 Tax=Kluyveromyces dobzhanskii CBS 2104 TaxID=1427455 RepID=A0A0A8KZ91_9SACH|nr:unnamed protein product [Kluyveromyces dobzhanskii CBS 2104]